MDKNEKNFASSVFNVCRKMLKVSEAYYNGKINRSEFIKLFLKDLSLLSDSFKIYPEK